MKALVLKEYNRFAYEDVKDPEPGPGEVLVEVKACGICGSDVHGMDGSTGRRIPPVIMGHEAAGVVVEGGAAGGRVTFDSTIYCGECAYCRRGRVNLCKNRRVLGVSCEEYRCDGAFAEFVAVPERIVYPLPEGLGFEQAAMTEPVSVAFHAVQRVPVALDDTALVVGAGVIGLLVVQVLRAAGCGRVIAVDVDDGRLEVACTLGADQGFNPRTGDAAAEIAAATGGRGVDVAFEAVGVAETVALAVNAVRKGGCVGLIGNVSPEARLPLQAAVTRELSMFGSCASSGEYPACLDLLARGVVDVGPLLSAVAPLEEGAAWFERLHAGEGGLLKVVLTP
ncbi:MAG: galactitol-1-phosphate 5-dehydrogenase [Candidatus Hydrogenedentes bacterium]|nr:galactitol-1-phosphate 5-dehydrogenase [Candidatus Hydrogenedentota bacterium]